MVACFYAAGFSPERIQEEFESIDQSRLYGRDSKEGPALLGLSRVRQWLKRTLADRTFADTRIPCAVTAVDIRSSREIIVREGMLRHGVLCTIALPGIFPSFRSGDLELVDGGLVNPVPVSVARSLAPGLPVVAVSLTGRMGQPPRSVPLPFVPSSPGTPGRSRKPHAPDAGHGRLPAVDRYRRPSDRGVAIPNREAGCDHQARSRGHRSLWTRLRWHASRRSERRPRVRAFQNCAGPPRGRCVFVA